MQELLSPCRLCSNMTGICSNASNSREINAAFDSFERARPDALFVGPGPYFLSRRVQLAHLATRYAVPAAYAERDYVEVGGLMSYGASLTEAYREMGVYAGRILRALSPLTFQSCGRASSNWSS